MPSGNNVNVQNNFFSPGQLNVTAGANVTWTWYSYGTTHHILFEDGENSQAQSSGTYERTFAAAGTYRYRCTYHSDNFGSGMIGSVVVQ